MDPEDASQELFLKVVEIARERQELSKDDAIRAVHGCYRNLRRKVTHPCSEQIYETACRSTTVFETVVTYDNHVELLDARNALQGVQTVLNTHATHNRKLATLAAKAFPYLRQGATCSEVAKVLGVPRAQVYNALKRAYRTVRKVYPHTQVA